AETRIALEVLDLVEIQAPADQPLQRTLRRAADQPFDTLRRIVRDETERRGDVGIAEKPAGERLVVTRNAAVAQLLERVRERIVADVVEQRGEPYELAVGGIEPVQRTARCEEIECAPGQVVDTESVIEARVG